jgi:hypothetical protein
MIDCAYLSSEASRSLRFGSFLNEHKAEDGFLSTRQRSMTLDSGKVFTILKSLGKQSSRILIGHLLEVNDATLISPCAR